MKRTALITLLLACQVGAHATPARSRFAIDTFKREHPCPSTGDARGPCPGYIVDHVVPLCAGGADDPRNLQWQTISDAHAKDKLEWQQCRGSKKAAPP